MKTMLTTGKYGFVSIYHMLQPLLLSRSMYASKFGNESAGLYMTRRISYAALDFGSCCRLQDTGKSSFGHSSLSFLTLKHYINSKTLSILCHFSYLHSSLCKMHVKPRMARCSFKKFIDELLDPTESLGSQINASALVYKF